LLGSFRAKRERAGDLSSAATPLPAFAGAAAAASVRDRSLGEQPQDRAQRDRLRQVRVEAALERTAAVLRQTVTRQRGEQYGAAEALAEVARDAVAVEAGQADVDEGGVGTKRARELDALEAVGGRRHLVARVLEQLAQALAHVRVVLDEKDPAQLEGGD